MGYCHREPPMRLWVLSYWNWRGIPEPQRMPLYALVMLPTGTPARLRHQGVTSQVAVLRREADEMPPCETLQPCRTRAVFPRHRG